MAIIRGRAPKEDDDEEVTLDDDADPDERPAFTNDDDDEIEIEEEGEMYEPSKDDDEEDDSVGKPDVKNKRPLYAFETQEELDAFIEAIAKRNAPTVTPAPIVPDPPKKDEIDDLVFYNGYVDKEGNWQGEAPKDWNDFARTIAKHLDPVKAAPKIMNEIKNMTKKEQDELKQIDAEFDAEYDELAAQKLVPNRKTPAGEAANKAISAIGGKYGLTSMKAAHELWADLPKEKGGKGAAVAPVRRSDASRKVARMIRPNRAGNAAPIKPKSKRSYAKLAAARSAADLYDDEYED